LISEAQSENKGKAVGKVVDAAEESEPENEEEEEAQEEQKKTTSPVVKAFQKITSPLRGIGKRKTTELSPGTIQDREAESSQRARGRQPSPSPSVEVPEVHRGTSSFYSATMPPPSSISSRRGDYTDPFYVRTLENELRESQEDLNIVLRRQESRESLLREEIATLKARLGEGSSGVSRSSEKRRGAGGSSGRH
jgi:hypothetical protein